VNKRIGRLPVGSRMPGEQNQTWPQTSSLKMPLLSSAVGWPNHLAERCPRSMASIAFGLRRT
jgi:hypothetical protein